MNRAFEKELSRALATELDTAAPKTLLRRCRAEHVVKQRSDWRDLLHCQFKLLGWKVWALEAMAALALYSVGRELALWEKAWTLRNALFGLSTLAMLTALLGLPFLYRASQYKMLELEQATYAGIGRPLVMRFLLLLAGETILLGVLVLNVRAAVPWSIGQLLAVLTVPFLTANNELLLLLRWVRPDDDDRGCTAVCRAAVFAAVRAIIGTAERSAAGGGRAGALYGVAVHPACRPVRIYCRRLKGASHGTENSEYYKAIQG